MVSYPLENGQLTSEEPSLLLSRPLTSGLHTGGTMRLDADGLLYIGIGDGALPTEEELQARTQDTSELAGSILRIDPTRGDPYAIPPDNPLVEDPDARPEIYAWGLRNPWGFSLDPGTGQLWVGDVGEGCWEEVNVVPPGGGVNLGWPAYEGTMATGRGPEPEDHVLAVGEYRHIGPASAVIGGHVYRGDDFPELSGAYLFGDYGQGSVFWLRRLPGGGVESGRLGVPMPFVTGLVETPDQEVVILTQDAGIFELVPP